MKASVHEVHENVHESTKQKMTFQNILFFYLYIFPCFYSRMSALKETDTYKKQINYVNIAHLGQAFVEATPP